MTELRFTDTNSADDSAGRAFGLEGNLYLAVVFAVVVGAMVAAAAWLLFQTGVVVTGAAGAVPILSTLAWILGLKHGKPAGYDRDWLEEQLNGGHFARNAAEQEGIL